LAVLLVVVLVVVDDVVVGAGVGVVVAVEALPPQPTMAARTKSAIVGLAGEL